MATEETIRSTLEERFLFQFDDQITRESNLFEVGVADSYGIIEIISFLEDNFSIKFTDDELLSPLWSNLAGMTELVTRKTKGWKA